MTLLSVLEDLVDRTLAAIPGSLAKLQYLAELRDGEGGCTHWGLARVYGQAAAQQAVTEAHRMILSEVLRTPLQVLLREVEASSAGPQLGADDYLHRLSADSASWLCPELGAGSHRHFNSVLLSLSRLVQAQASTTHRAA